MPPDASIPRRKRPTPEQRLRTSLRALPGFAEGQSKSLGLVRRGALAVLQASGIFALVIHNDDPDLSRPACLFVYWLGSAQPNNGQEFDWWYTENVDA